ncbi:MAG: hypothetical protein MI748_17870, partial [Opitutales bacterium]|nr:hypothetical protein [Opitutales bacterium]
MTSQNKNWLVVDLDYSLVKTDLFIEQILRALLTRPWMFVKMLFASGFNIPRLKHLIARRMEISYQNLPYNQTVLDKIASAKMSGSKILLATAASEIHAKQVCDHLGLFDAYIASDSEVNLKGE